MFSSSDTIAAISSGALPAARMIVRMSGGDAHAIARSLCETLSRAGEAKRVQIRFADLTIPAWVYLFAHPHSYSGEDLVEFHIPGNPLLARMLLNALLERGARHAEPGEFTARAYFAGRLDLAEAEGVAATIAAHGEQEARAARQLLAGEFANRLRPMIDSLTETLALVEAGIDFTDEGISFLAHDQLIARIHRVDESLAELIAASARFERLTHEPTFVLIGRPNAGKSTLLNALAGYERAIVSPVAGTTRDALSAEVPLPRGIVRLIDIAGLDDITRGGDEAIEQIERRMAEVARAAAEKGDYVLLIRECGDARAPIALPRSPDRIVWTKADLHDPSHDGIVISALTGLGMVTLRQSLDCLAFGDTSSRPAALALNARHLDAIAAARTSLARLLETVTPDAAAEVVALELREALDALGQILGQVTPDDVLGRIFSTFCIGK